MEEAKGLFLYEYRNKDLSDEPCVYDMETFGCVIFGENKDAIQFDSVVYKDGKRGVKLLFCHGSDEEEAALFVGDTATFRYSYTEITDSTDREEVDNYTYLKLVEK